MAVYEFIAWIGTVYPRPVIRLESFRPPKPGLNVVQMSWPMTQTISWF